jgi:hypothetical protein
MLSQTLTITFADYNTKASLANILVFTDGNPIGISNNTGKIELEMSQIVDNKIKAFSYLYHSQEVELLASDKSIKIELLPYQDATDVKPNDIEDIPALFVPLMKMAKKNAKLTANYNVVQQGNYNLHKERRAFKKDFSGNINLNFKKTFDLKTDEKIDDTIKQAIDATFLCDPIRTSNEDIFTNSDNYVFNIIRIVHNTELGCNVFDINLKTKDQKDQTVVGAFLVTNKHFLQLYKETLRSSKTSYNTKLIFIYKNDKNHTPYCIENQNLTVDETQRNTVINKIFLR